MKVTISCQQVVEFSKVVEMPESEFRQLRELTGEDISGRKNPDEYLILDGYLSPGDIIGSDQEFLNVQAIPIGKGGGWHVD